MAVKTNTPQHVPDVPRATPDASKSESESTVWTETKLLIIIYIILYKLIALSVDGVICFAIVTWL